jgi:hypothetical protein
VVFQAPGSGKMFGFLGFCACFFGVCGELWVISGFLRFLAADFGFYRVLWFFSGLCGLFQVL